MGVAAVLLIDPHLAGFRGDSGQRFAFLAQIHAERRAVDQGLLPVTPMGASAPSETSDSGAGAVRAPPLARRVCGLDVPAAAEVQRERARLCGGTRAQ
jgi:hypothetical protein